MFMVELERGPSGLGMGLIDGMVRTLDLSPPPPPPLLADSSSTVSIVRLVTEARTVSWACLWEPSAFLWDTPGP